MWTCLSNGDSKCGFEDLFFKSWIESYYDPEDTLPINKTFLSCYIIYEPQIIHDSSHKSIDLRKLANYT